ncbi:MAG TPA: Rpp14/Pop5 family protein [Methanoregulaceae archaeon]|nr:Rpp14/Pop5 family protein [Methanoregulaceae archaeon]HOV68670.1 Rpp14/Pop5 family protein [Methanoregulaceae archaeon]HQJ87696.1 Rpp14/Pop5 family protein [Methanoregulaceae archaeon]
MKPRPPTLRQNRRYLLVRTAPSYVRLEAKPLYLAIGEAVTALFGDQGAARIDQAVVAVMAGYVVVRCRRGEEGRLTAALATVTGVAGQRVALHPRAVSGTIQSLRTRIAPVPEPVVLGGEGSETDPRRVRIGAARVDVIVHDYKGENVVHFETIHPEDR